MEHHLRGEAIAKNGAVAPKPELGQSFTPPLILLNPQLEILQPQKRAVKQESGGAWCAGKGAEGPWQAPPSFCCFYREAGSHHPDLCP